MPIRKRTAPRSAPRPARGRGLWLFLLGALVGAAAAYLLLGHRLPRSWDGLVAGGSGSAAAAAAAPPAGTGARAAAGAAHGKRHPAAAGAGTGETAAAGDTYPPEGEGEAAPSDTAASGAAASAGTGVGGAASSAGAPASALAAVPGAVGVNNHMGSGLSSDAGAMTAILTVIGARRLFFLDSRTTAESVGFKVATALGIPAAERQVFLDDDMSPDAVAGQFQRLLDLARTRGAAIAIGHPHPATLATLAAEIPRAEAQGFRFVPVSALLDRPAAPPAATPGR